jgi:hypothetical protein
MFRIAVECAEGAPIVTSRSKTIHEAELFEWKGATAVFMCQCPACSEHHLVERRTTGIRHIPTRCMSGGSRNVYPIKGYPYKLAVPTYMTHGETNGFDLGAVHFTFEKHQLVPDRPLPESWLVDIGDSYDVLD